MLHNNYNGNNTNGAGEEAQRAQGPGAVVLSPSRPPSHLPVGAGPDPELLAVNRQACYPCPGVWRGVRGQQPGRRSRERKRVHGETGRRASAWNTLMHFSLTHTHAPCAGIPAPCAGIPANELQGNTRPRLPYKSSQMHSAGPLCIIHAENMETSYPDALCFL